MKVSQNVCSYKTFKANKKFVNNNEVLFSLENYKVKIDKIIEIFTQSKKI